MSDKHMNNILVQLCAALAFNLEDNKHYMHFNKTPYKKTRKQ